MNVFYLENCPMLCAIAHCDKHVVKMILESAQMLSTAIHLKGDFAHLAPTHQNHPSSVWARSSRENYEWLCELAFWLCTEYTYRYGKVHSLQDYIEYLNTKRFLFEESGFTEPPMAMPDHCKIGNSIESYRYYYKTEKKHLLKYTKRLEPIWL